MARLNRAIALSMVDGAAAGIAELEAVEADLPDYTLLPAVLGALWLRAGDPGRAAEHYRRALALPCSEPQRRFLTRRLAACSPD